ncbi:MAG: hypothetical protein IIB31_03075 [Chloroflexi bacterium]|nr:hypothetical protein [Chloroflexota bacterium]
MVATTSKTGCRESLLSGYNPEAPEAKGAASVTAGALQPASSRTKPRIAIDLAAAKTWRQGLETCPPVSIGIAGIKWVTH